MKYLLLLLISNTVFADFNRASAYEQYKFMTAKDYSCFVYSHKTIPEFSWEKLGLKVGKPYMLIRHDDKGVLIAQPSSYCTENQSKKVQFCQIYWVKSVAFDDWWLNVEGKANFVSCPKGLNKKFINAYIKSEYGDEINLGE